MPIDEQKEETNADEYAAFADSFEQKLDGTASGSDDEDEHDESDGSRPSDDADEHDDGDEEEDGEDDESDDGGEEEEGDGADDDDDEGEDADEDDDDESSNEAAAADVQKALKDAGLKLSIKDLPKEVRPIVQRKLDEIQAAFTRMRQGDTATRKELRDAKSELMFFRDNPALAIVELLKKSPKVSEEVNALIDKLSDEDKARLFDTDVKEARKKVTDQLDQQDRNNEQTNEHADKIEAYVRRAAAKLNVPIEEAEEAIALRILMKPEAKRAEGLSEDEIDEILTKKARFFKGAQRRSKLEERQRGIRQRTDARRTSTPAVRAGASAAPPRPGSKVKTAKNDEEFARQFEKKL